MDSPPSTADWQLLDAAIKGDIAQLLEVISLACPNVSYGPRSGTALHAAAHAGHLEVVETLLLYGWALQARTDHGDTALHLAAMAGHVDMVKMLMQYGISHAAVNTGDGTPLHAAAAGGHTAVMDVLLDAGADINAAGKTTMAPIHWACKMGHAAAVSALMKAGVAADSVCQGSGWTALRMAAAAGHLAVVRLLLQAGADVDAVDSRGCTALHMACRYGHGDVMKELIASGARPDKQSSLGVTALFAAVEGGHTELVRLLLDVPEMVASIDAAITSGQTPLHVACKLGHSDIVPLLLAHGADIRAVSVAGSTPLRLAVVRQHLPVVQVLLAAGADPCAPARNGVAPVLHEAARAGNSAIVQELLAAMSADQRCAGANMFVQGVTPLHWALEKGSAGCVEVLVAAGADASKLYGAEARNATGRSLAGATALHRAVQLGHVAAVPLLATPHNMRHMWKGCTPLHMALAAKKADVAQALVAAGSPAGVPARNGVTALRLAAVSRDGPLRLLLPAMIRTEWVAYKKQQQQEGVVQDPHAVPPAVVEGMCALLLHGLLNNPEEAATPAQSPQLGASCFNAVLDAAGVAAASALLQQVMKKCQESDDAPGHSCFIYQLAMMLQVGWLAALDPVMQVRWGWANRLQRLVKQQQQQQQQQQWQGPRWCSQVVLIWQQRTHRIDLEGRAKAAANAGQWQVFVRLLEQLAGAQHLSSVKEFLIWESGRQGVASGLYVALLQAWWDARQLAAHRASREAADVVVSALLVCQGSQLPHPLQRLSKLLLEACGAMQQQAAAGAMRIVRAGLYALVAWVLVVACVVVWVMAALVQ